MKSTYRAKLLAATVLVVATADWMLLQWGLTWWQGREAALRIGHRQVAATADAASHGLPAPRWAAPELSVDFWHSTVVASALQLVALSLVALLLVAAGRRRSWLPVALAILAYPTVAAVPRVDLRPIGAAWQGGGWTLLAVGTLVDLVAVALPALTYLLATRHVTAPGNAPARQVLEMVAAPAVVVASVLAWFGLSDLEAHGSGDRIIAAVLVLVTAGLLASTKIGVLRATLVTTVAAVVVTQAGNLTSGPLVVTAAVPIAVLALTGAVCAVHGARIAAAYRGFVRRPLGTQLSG